MEFSIKTVKETDWEAVRAIYIEGLRTGQATFEITAPTEAEWNAGHLPFARVAAIAPDHKLIGWAALTPISRRQAYAGVAEVSVYVTAEATGRGVGRELLQQLIAESERNGIWTLQASIFPENEASLKLHQSQGFRTVGRRHRISKLNGVWRDTLILERRSDVVGLD